MYKRQKGGFFNGFTCDPEALIAQRLLNPGAMSDLGLQLPLQRFLEPGAGELASKGDQVLAALEAANAAQGLEGCFGHAWQRVKADAAANRFENRGLVAALQQFERRNDDFGAEILEQGGRQPKHCAGVEAAVAEGQQRESGKPMALAGGTQGGFDDLEIDQVSPAAQLLEHLGFQVASILQPRQELLACLGVVTDTQGADQRFRDCLLYTSPSPRD